MPCEYCGYYDHAKSDCPAARSDQRRDAVLGRLAIVGLAPLVIVGAIIGLIYSGLRAGFMCTRDLWNQAMALVRKKPDPPETA